MELKRYQQVDKYADPGDYTFMFADVTHTLDELCELVQKQIVHPWGGGKQPKGRKYEPQNNYFVQEMLKQLHQYNADGLTINRSINERIIGSCRENAMMLTAILRHQGVPSRTRAGWVKYVSTNPEKFTDHWVSEVWHKDEKRWMLVDSNPQKVDFAQAAFLPAGDAWLNIRSGKDSPATYRTDDDLFYLKLNFGHDFNCILGSSPHYWEAPAIFHMGLNDMEAWHLSLLDELAYLLQKPDQHLKQLVALQKGNVCLQKMESAWTIFEKTVYR